MRVFPTFDAIMTIVMLMPVVMATLDNFFIFIRPG